MPHKMSFNIRIDFNVAMAIALGVGEAVSMLWYLDGMPLAYRAGERSLLPAVAFDAGLVCTLKAINDNLWRVRDWKDAMYLSGWISVLYFCLEGPHTVYNFQSLSRCFVHCVHKFSVIFAMYWAMDYFRNY